MDSLGPEEVLVLISRLSLAFGMRKGQGPSMPLTKTRSQEAHSAFPTLLLLFGKEVATAAAPVAPGYCSAPPPPNVYHSGSTSN